MNIQVQICGLIMLIMLAIFFFGNRRIGLYTEKVFVRTLISGIICLSLDILSVVAIMKIPNIDSIWVHISCKLYLISLVFMAFAGMDYVLTDIIFDEKKYKKIIKYIMMFLGIEMIIVMLLPIHAYKEGRVVYSYGLSTTVTYGCAFSFIIATIMLLIFGFAKINRRRRIAMSIWMLMWVAAASTQFVYNDILIVGFAVAMGVLIIFIMLENPEALHDRRYGCFNSHALLLFTHQVYDRGEHYALVDIYFEDNDNELLSDNNDEVFNRVVDYFDYKKDFSVYKNVENEFVVYTMKKDKLYDDIKELQQEYAELINERMKNGLKTPVMKIVAFDDCMKVKKPQDIFIISSRIRNSIILKEGSEFILAQEEDIEKYYKYDEIVREIKLSLEEDRVEVFYQPIFSREKKQFTSCEALVRIRKNDGTLIPPGEFVYIAEETGLIVPLGERVFEKVCQFLRNEKEIYDKLDYVEINLSVAQLEQKGFADKFLRIMKFYGIDSNKINFEITETAVIHTKSTLSENMNEFLDNGFKFSLDDFGKGESNLMYLVEMPVSIVKLDMDMTQAYFVEPKAKYVLEATVRMAHDIGIYVVAEGIEEKEQLDTLLDEQIDFIQGFFFSRPVNSEEFKKLILAKCYS